MENDKRPISILLLVMPLLIAAPDLFAWGGVTHRYIARKVCERFECQCPKEVELGSTAPDREFKDTVNHHCYDMEWPCDEDASTYSCPVKQGCPALKKSGEWLDKARSQTGCERWRSIAIASHYYSDGEVIWHKVQKETGECHSDFESAVDNKVKGKQKDWSVTVCGETVTKTDIDRIIDGFCALVSSGAPPPAAGKVRVESFVREWWGPGAAAAGVLVVLLLGLRLAFSKKRRRR